MPSGSGFYVDSNQELWLTGRATGKPTGVNGYSGCFTVYYVDR